MNLLGNQSAEEDGEFREFYLEAQFITGLILYPITCLIGLAGNTLSIIVMSQHQMKSSTNIYLMALAISDCIKVFSDLLYFMVILLKEVNRPVGNRAYGFLYPYMHYIFNASLCISAWLVVSVAVERYVYVCHPTRVKAFCTIPRARTVSTSVFVIMSLLTIPYAMRYRTVENYDAAKQDFIYDVNLTTLWQNQTFSTAYIWLHNLLRSIIPLIVLIILNTCIIYGLRRCRLTRKRISSRHRVTIMLIFIIVVFLVCITPDAIMSTFFGFGYYEENYLARGIREITDFLLLINAATNFVLYCIFNTIFWCNFKALFVNPCKQEKRPMQFEDSAYRKMSATGRGSFCTTRKGSEKGEPV